MPAAVKAAAGGDAFAPIESEVRTGRVTGQLALGELSLSEMISEPGNGAEIPLDDEQNLRVVQAVAATVSSSPLLSELDSDLVRYLIECGSIAHVRAGQAVFMEGESGTSLYLILQGEVDVERESEGTIKRLATLRRGAFFGEMALLTDTPRTATVRAVKTTTLLAASRKAVRKLVDSEPRVLKLLMRFFRARLVGTLVATSPLFKPFSADDRRALVTRFRLREIEGGRVVIEKGSASDGLYMVLMGRLVAYLPDEERVLGPLGPGDAFGEMSLLSGASAMASIRTETRSWVLRLPREDFEELTGEHPELAKALEELASSRREQNRDSMRDQSVRPV
jgi:CRP-like cAMP-binding protein